MRKYQLQPHSVGNLERSGRQPDRYPATAEAQGLRKIKSNEEGVRCGRNETRDTLRVSDECGLSVGRRGRGRCLMMMTMMMMKWAHASRKVEGFGENTRTT